MLGFAPLGQLALGELPAASGSNQSVSVPAAAVVVAGQVPTIRQAFSINVPAASVVVAGQTPTVRQPHAVSAPAAAVVVAGRVPTVGSGQRIAIPAAAVAVAGVAPVINRTQSILCPAAPIIVRGLVPTILRSGAGSNAAGGVVGSAGRKKRTLVEIDGETFTVRSVGEAQALLANARDEAEALATRAAKTALNKARDAERKTGRLPALEVAVPALTVAAGADPEIAALVIEAQQGVDEVYLKAAQEVELAWLARRAYYEQDEEDVATLLLLS